MRFQQLPSGRAAVFSPSGDFALVDASELEVLQAGPRRLTDLPPARLADLYAKHLITGADQRGMAELLRSRRAARRETIEVGVSLHILVPTLQCAHSCQYCQVSRALDSTGFEMTPDMLDAACDAVFESPSQVLTVEFQGGDPLIRFDLVQRAIERITRRNRIEGRRIQFVVASTLHQLNVKMCEFFSEHAVVLSTSIDGPPALHNKNRPIPGRDAYERTVAGIAMARKHIHPGCVSALMTTTKASLAMPEAIIDEYVRLGFDEVFVRPLANHGFAMRNAAQLGHALESFFGFYTRCLDRVLWWNQQGVALREAAAAAWLNKLLSPFDSGYVDLQSPTGAGSAVLVYNYDGFVYPSDEARMLAETGNASLRLGRIGEPLRKLEASEVVQHLRAQSDGEARTECANCPYHTSCGPDPVEALACGSSVTVHESGHCRRSTWMFRHFLDRVDRAETDGDEDFLDLAYAWARREHPKRANRTKPVAASLSLPQRQPDSGMRQGLKTSQFKGITVCWSDEAEN
ncbi:His-Xaa-Ser system radical SAM maturase HxsB [uncultured Piscinibacter sp.]|uniref:His-Xaa-Ser system radical SAM maturase HxsB n=1 Tax=uncultured Piscinibacter sp. TaxID=1131835 RepID=UPI0026042379|nr:His-Xaa-Ser system radical SAM maturase HxsB [uncultured Piscinibacter sp.]